MLYIFLEDPGIMVKFEMTFALESVATLKKAIEERCHIPASEQILLISGGERLEDNQRVGKYHTGTDNNPIFLFRDVANSPPPSVVDVNEYLQDLSESVNAVLDLPPTIRTVISRSALAQKLCISAQEQLRLAEGLIHDQHLQQQGWAAVLAHLDDMIVYYSAMCSACEKTYVQFLDIRDTFVDLLNSFNEDLTRISKLPVLPALLTSDEIEPPDSGMSLLDWITSHKDGDNDQTLAEVASFCSRSIQILDQKLMSKVAELREYIKIAESNYRDVKVIETKLEHLDQVMHASKRIVQDQISQAQTFNSNKTSAIKEQDASILKELCTFHREWLLVMESNHTQLCKNLKTCASYKSDLCAYLQTRLQWNLKTCASYKSDLCAYLQTRLQWVSETRGCDSEGTDTEEFEKLRHSGQTVSECSESNETIRANMRQLGQDANQGLV
ncbi:RB1-inducible coiled-coil protein 1-like [Diaphorina citri]|uniref:RB1-inducible coiled-coil protein 1-like n=1 Tax=Diaphorina citri TaxID=121845 RepID=A0A3Q0IT10_DIACI|nr:RB1-inducible coiled-coil protein 1-like [Diaphorina citri]